MKSFTLIEMLISFIVLAILAGIIIISPGKGANIYRLKNASFELISQIDKARAFSLSNIKFNNLTFSGGWGINFNINNNFYIIFADINQNKYFDANEKSETIYLFDNLLISELKVNSLSVNTLDIIFEPPNIKIYINGIEGNKAYIIIKDKDNDTETVTINAVGGIDY